VNDGNNSSSTESSPTFTFNELGEYVVDLAVVNSEGCTTTTSKIISVIVPSLDVELTSLTLIPVATGETNLLISMTNKSKSPVTDLKALVDIGGGAIISENIDAIIQPGQSHTRLLSSNIVGKGANLNYVCVEIVVDGDDNPSNNKKCVSNEDVLVVFEPYPNPGSDNLNISWIATESGDAELNMFDPAGRKVLESKFVNFAEGYNNVTTSLANLNPGIYYVLFVSANSRKSFRYVVRK
jgi:PKD repeat protein